MKKIIIPIGALLMAHSVHAQLTQGENYVYSKSYLDYNATGQPTKTAETVQYFDGLGRPKQVVNVKASPLGRDVVTHIEYDAFGRQTKEYLPVPQSGTLNGGIVPSSLANATQPDIYGSEKIYSEKILENSPLDRILEQKQVGNDWSTKPVKFGYDAVIVADRVRKFTTVTTWENGATKSVLGENWLYTDGQLYKNSVKDEDLNETIEFKNGKGQLILARKVIAADEYADTYYVYNEFNQLAFVIPPLASIRGDIVANTVKHDELCYQYRYDGRNRLVEKKLPGKGWEYMVYDKQDRLVAIQDANLKAKGHWLYTKYDQFGRVTITGISTGGLRSAEQAQAELQNSNNVGRISTVLFNRQGMDVYYDNPENTYPKSPTWITLLSLNYYDSIPNYSFNPLVSDVLGEPLLTPNPIDGRSTKGFPVLSLIKNIEDDNWTKKYIYYDTKGRGIGTYSINHLGGYTKTESKLDFAGVPQTVVTRHKRLNTDTERIITENFTYNHQNRLLTHTHKVDNNPEEILAQNTYNELSQLENKKVGAANPASPLQTIDYKYNIRGWMTAINNPESLGSNLFGYKLKYQTPASSVSIGKFNGNVSELDWKSSNDGILRRYSYQYDKLNRLLAAKYQKPNSDVIETNAYNESVTYDLNGNIQTLLRFGGSDSNLASKIDDVKYTYEGNQLVDIWDSSGNYLGLDGGDVMYYDANGNVISDNAHFMDEINYNHLNLPNRIVKQVEYYEYLYSADGTKLRSFHNMKEINKIIGTEYLDGFQYQDGILQFIPTSEGYYSFTDNRYVYNYTDHLGNVRLSYTKNGAEPQILEENNYYPFGLKHTGYNSAPNSSSYNYKYNGKELMAMGMYDYGARMYMPDIARWGVVDPLAEQYRRWSPYNYAMNNPINFIDPDGRGTESTHTDKFGNVVKVIEDGDLGVYRHNGNTKETQQELNQKYSKDNTSGGGERMGRTLVWNSFTQFDGNGDPAGKINFGSFQARDWLKSFSDAISEDAEVNGGWGARMNYATNAGGGDKYDYKTQNGGGLYAGSQIAEGVYVSARDVGNFAAGRAASITGQDKMDFMLNAGGFNISGNSKLGLIFNNSHWKSEAQKAGFPTYGEHFNSNLFQRLGYENVTTAEGIIKKNKIIWGDRK
ncbi:DUF6443 domain-containing protein [Chryseobacterium sp. OSA05B]|uniref:DUF6443 domain-containing protein n=1 Tax=Chryseobacterium sp. OSA05B TaxID=2862650 RepID=UPI001CC06950|nr:DUF6443 domain-containing protein [Chryseobacterium sp. OSA05B]